MQSIRLCLGESDKLSEEFKSSLEKVRDSFMSMSKIPVQFGGLKIKGLLYSLNISNELGLTYLDCEFTSREEGA